MKNVNCDSAVSSAAYTYSNVLQEEETWRINKERGLPLVVIRPRVIFGLGIACKRCGNR